MNLKLLVRILIYSLIVVLVCLIFLLLIGKFGQELGNIIFGGNKFQANLIGSNQPSTQAAIESQALKPLRDWSVPDFLITANAATCVDVSNDGNDRILFRENTKEKFPIASLTKLMTALVVLDHYDLEKVTVISQEAVDQSGGQGLLGVDENLSLDSLLKIMLVESSNDAAYSLAEVMGVKKFIDLMNETAQKIGLFNTSFTDPAGLDAGNVSTAEDLVKLAKYLLNNYPQVWQISSLNNYRLLTPQGKLHHELLNTNELLGEIPDIVGGKTGKTLEAKGCLLIIVKNPQDQDILIYVLLGSSDRFGEMRNLINWVNTAYKR